ncbi:MAG: hypothetical protein HFF87_04500 [Oscillibacter sp.]|jgi:hypothetical protein|nr:hypothetical protein [Oscillibacter sp.]MCI9481020.1 hypothetical protein [Oscillibacter sp.]
MGKNSKSITKTSRLLVIFHLFRNCQEVSFQEITDMLPIGQKTACRDIRLLKQAGVLQIRYSRRQKAFVLTSLDFTEPEWPENQTRKLYLEKIRRLCTLMVQIERAENPIAWYQKNYPRLSARTRQRDFKELGKIGYRIGYNPIRNPDRDWDPNYEPGWFCDFPTGAYDITF